MSAKSGGSSAGAHARSSAPATLISSSGVPGDGVRDFFFRVASLTFEAIVLSELETGGSKHVGDIVSESVFPIFASHWFIWPDEKVNFHQEIYPHSLKVFCPVCPELTDTGEDPDQPPKKKPNCCR